MYRTGEKVHRQAITAPRHRLQRHPRAAVPDPSFCRSPGAVWRGMGRARVAAATAHSGRRLPITSGNRRPPSVSASALGAGRPSPELAVSRAAAARLAAGPATGAESAPTSARALTHQWHPGSAPQIASDGQSRRRQSRAPTGRPAGRVKNHSQLLPTKRRLRPIRMIDARCIVSG